MGESANGQAQGSPQGKKREIRSPRNGAVVKTFAPGQSGNPAGSSAKQRLKSALATVVDVAAAEGMVRQAVADARSAKNRSNGLKALELICKAAGLMTADSMGTITVHHEIRSSPRASGAVPPQVERVPRVAQAGSGRLIATPKETTDEVEETG